MLHSRKLQSMRSAAAVLLATGVAFADTSPPKPCTADVKSLCPKVKAGHGAILVCLEQQVDKISSECKDSLTEKAQALESACKLDLDKFCGAVEAGEGRQLQCLAKHEADMTADCKAFWGAAKTKAKAASK
ncbi:MAG TPA: cysteine rich repeat-containing protein [Myxococcaceae bacterium]|nr:cysteine rich repeat-containing protein [Myxococcaceae bacterium]